jgi:hypothetical protein
LLTLLRQKGGFSPLDLPGLALWLDASDLSTITHSSGAVSQWDDKSGNGFHVAQAIASRQPALGIIGGLNAISFDGGDVLSRPTVGLLRAVSGATLIVVRRYNEVPSAVSAQAVVAVGTGVLFRAALYGDASGYQTAGGRTQDADSFALVSTGENVSIVAPELVVGIFEHAITRLTLRVNGEQKAFTDSFQTATVTSDTNSERFAVGANAVADTVEQPFTGAIGEVLIYHRALAVAELRQVEAYAARWGVTLT